MNKMKAIDEMTDLINDVSQSCGGPITGKLVNDTIEYLKKKFRLQEKLLRETLQKSICNTINKKAWKKYEVNEGEIKKQIAALPKEKICPDLSVEELQENLKIVLESGICKGKENLNHADLCKITREVCEKYKEEMEEQIGFTNVSEKLNELLNTEKNFCSISFVPGMDHSRYFAYLRFRVASLPEQKLYELGEKFALTKKKENAVFDVLTQKICDKFLEQAGYQFAFENDNSYTMPLQGLTCIEWYFMEPIVQEDMKVLLKAADEVFAEYGIQVFSVQSHF